MIDRELLERAAKAAGIEYEWRQEGYVGGETGIVPEGWRRCWNPLTDDGDALWLAVKLGLDVDNAYDYVEVQKYSFEKQKIIVCISEDLRKDPYAATRRAIVRAAAEIGKDVK